MKLGFSYKFLFYLLLIVILAYISLKYFNVIEGNRGRNGLLGQKVKDKVEIDAETAKTRAAAFVGALDTNYLSPIPIP